MTRHRATLVVHSETLTGEEISGLIGRQATRLSERGEPVSRRRPASGRRKFTAWELTSSLDERRELAAHLADLLPHAEAARPALTAILHAGGQVFWSCFVTAKPTGNLVSLEPELLARLALVGVPLTFDVYDSDPDR